MNNETVQCSCTNDFFKFTDHILANSNRKFFFLTSDLSNFKYVNKFYGIDSGDELLHHMADFFFKYNAECIAFCNPGCDQFKAFFELTCSRQEVVDKIISMNHEFEAIVNHKYPNVFIHVYTGIYFLEDNSEDSRKALDNANDAKKQIKGNFENSCQVYKQSVEQNHLTTMEATNMFITACNEGRLVMYLQPKISLSQDCLVGAEALARIIDTDGSVIPPYKFIPTLEKTGMIGKLDELMIEIVFQKQAEWMKQGRKLFPISVNVSRLEYIKSNFTDYVINLQRKYNIPPQCIEFEILESTFIDAVDSIINTTNTLRDYGFLVSVDDFGSGYSCLNQIANMPADTVKLDNAFAKNSLNNNKGCTVIKSLIQLLNNIGYNVVFEGIETKEQCELAHSFGCDIIQGYYFSKPICIDDFENKYMLI